MGIFSSVPKPKVKRSVFGKSITFENKLSFDFGMIVPIFAKDLLPGDNFYYSPEAFMRTSPLIAPLMQLCDVHIDVMKYPMRLLMRESPQIPGFETFMSPKDVFGDGEQPEMTRFNLVFGSNVTAQHHEILEPGSLSDFLGIPTIDSNIEDPILYEGQEMSFRALDHIAYQWCYDEFFRNENLQDPILDEDAIFYSHIIEDDEEIGKLMKLRFRNWPKDYFTSALPNTQRGIDVGIPITADVDFSGHGEVPVIVTAGQSYSQGVEPGMLIASGSTTQSDPPRTPIGVGGAQAASQNDPMMLIGRADGEDVADALKGTLSSVIATVNDLRLSVALQSWAEASMRGGARYPEILMSTFGVRPRDARLQRPECMGRVSFPLQISEVLQTSQSTTGEDGSPQGNMSGRAIAYGRGRYIHVYAEEHCILHAYLSIMPRASYQQGLPKRYTKFDKFDYYWPQFDALGEQPLKTRELFYDFNHDWDDILNNDKTFGYQQRYCEYKAFPNEVHGDFKTLGLNAWHMGRIFGSAPSLDEDFINYEPEIDAINQRIFASGSTTRSHIQCQVFNRLRAKRPMSYQVIPHLKG